MAKARKALKVDVRAAVLHAAGYKCGNPSCRNILTIDVHHIVAVAQDGGDEVENLLALCPYCHALHHRGEIPIESIRAWKMLLVAVNEALPRDAVDLLLALSLLETPRILVSTDFVLSIGSLIASGLVKVEHPYGKILPAPEATQARYLSLSEKGAAFVSAWKAGNQSDAVGRLQD